MTKLSKVDQERVQMLRDSRSIFRLPGPQSGKTPLFSKGQQLVVELYHRTLLLLRRGEILFDGPASDSTISSQHHRLWSLINECRIIQVPTELYESLRSTAAHMVAADAGIGDEMRTPDVSQEIKRLYLRSLEKLTATADIPEKMPFEKLYFAFDRPLQMDEEEANGYGFRGPPVWVYAFVVTQDEVYMMVIVEELRKRSSAVSVIPIRASGAVLTQYYRDLKDTWLDIRSRENQWAVLGSMCQFVVPWFVEWVNSHQTTITEDTRSFSYRRHYKKRGSEFGMSKPIPKPYYTVYIKDEMLTDFSKKKQEQQLIRKKCEHQYDVRGTWVCRITRGSLPIDPKVEKELRSDKRRKLFITEKPDSETAAHLAKRGVSPKRVDEWLAVLVYWRSDHKRGPAGGPYIPSIRKSARHKETDHGVVSEGLAVNL